MTRIVADYGALLSIARYARMTASTWQQISQPIRMGRPNSSSRPLADIAGEWKRSFTIAQGTFT
jgi:hypothetical protein